MSVVAAAVIGGGLLGAGASIYGAKKAAGAQQDATDKAINTELEMFERNAELQEPWRQLGIGAIGQISDLMGMKRPEEAFDKSAYLQSSPEARAWVKQDPGNTAYEHYLRFGRAPESDFMRDFSLADFEKDPGYQFRMDEGTRTLDAGAAARGGLLSGGAMKDLTRFGQDYASGEYTNAYNRFNADRDRRFGRLTNLAGIGQTATGQLTNQGAQTAANIGNYQTQAGNARASGYVGAANAFNQGLGTIGNYFGQQALMNPPAVTPAPSWGTPGLNNFFFGSGTGGD